MPDDLCTLAAQHRPKRPLVQPVLLGHRCHRLRRGQRVFTGCALIGLGVYVAMAGERRH